MSTTLTRCAALFMSLIVSTGLCAPSGPLLSVAVIVHMDNPVDNVTDNELRDFLMGVTSQWPNRRNVIVAEREPGSQVLETILRRCVRATAQDYNRQLLDLEFRGKKPAVIKTLRSDEAACAFVFNVPGAIGFVANGSLSLTSCRNQVKIIRVNGKDAGDPGYRLSEASR
jgi:hypothetical protein